MDKLTGSLQENLLVALCWSDKLYSLIRNAVEPNLFTTLHYRDTIARVYDFIDRYKKPPKDHLPDLIEDRLTDEKAGELYQQMLQAVIKIKDGLNEVYIRDQLDRFVHTQNLKLGFIRASELINEGKPEEAEAEFEKYRKKKLALFSPGMTLREGLAKLKSREIIRDCIPLGIPELDKHQATPARGELHHTIGPKKGGKSWWLGHVSKRALMIRWKVALITLEIREPLATARMLQSLFALTYREANRVMVTRFKKNELGQIISFEREKLARTSLHDDEGLAYAEKGLNNFAGSDNLIVKGFPAGQLSMGGLRAYLDSMEQEFNFIPDLIAVDYPYLMKRDLEDVRLGLGKLAVDLRGLADERNAAVVVVGQSSKIGVERGDTRDTDAAEDFSINFTADMVQTYSQTDDEHKLGLGRLVLADSRISRQHIKLMISQNYEIGQFCIDSAPMLDTYFSTVKEMTGKREE